MKFPSSRIPIQSIFRIFYSMLSKKKKDIQVLSKEMLEGIVPPPVFIGKEYIPTSGSFLLTLNHYSRDGFSVVWAAAAVSAVMPKKPIWVMTSAWTKRTGFWDQIKTRVTTVFFSRFAEVFGAVTMPPMPPHPDEIADRALSIRKVLNWIRAEKDTILCIAPEGADQANGLLGRPYPGTGKFISMICSELKYILPVGVYEESGKLILQFGKPYTLNENKSDQSVIDQVMKHIANLLPEKMIPQ